MSSNWVNDELVEVKQETADTEAISDQDFEKVVRQVNGKRADDVIINEVSEKNCEGIREVGVVEDRASSSDPNFDLIVKQLKADTLEEKARRVNQPKDEGLRIINPKVDKSERQDLDPS